MWKAMEPLWFPLHMNPTQVLKRQFFLLSTISSQLTINSLITSWWNGDFGSRAVDPSTPLGQ